MELWESRWGICPGAEGQERLCGGADFGRKHAKYGVSQAKWTRVRMRKGITSQAEGTTRAKFQAKEPETRKGQEVVWWREKQDCRGNGKRTGTGQRLNFILKATGSHCRVLRMRTISSMF